MPAGAAAALANPPANAPDVPVVEAAPSIARILSQHGWTEDRNGSFYYPGVVCPRIHIVLSADAKHYNPRVSIYDDVKTVKVQVQPPAGDMITHTFWHDDVKQRYDAILVNTALALLPAPARLILQELLAE